MAPGVLLVLLLMLPQVVVGPVL